MPYPAFAGYRAHYDAAYRRITDRPSQPVVHSQETNSSFEAVEITALRSGWTNSALTSEAVSFVLPARKKKPTLWPVPSEPDRNPALSSVLKADGVHSSGLRNSYKWWVVLMLWWICFFNYADRQAIYAVFPKLQQEFGFTKLQLGLIGSAFMWVYAAAAPVAGLIVDRFRRKDLILGGCLFWSAITVMTGWCSKLYQFVIVRAAEGLGETFYFPASMSLTSDYHGQSTRSRALSLHQSSVYAGTVIGSWLGAWFAERHGWRIGFYFFGASGMILALLLYRFLQEPRRGAADQQTFESPNAASQAPEFNPTRLPFAKPSIWLLMAGFVCANFVATIFLTWTPTFLVEKFGFKLTQAGLSGSLFIHLASFLSVPMGGIAADRFSRRWPGGRIFVQAGGLIIGSAFIVLVGHTRDVPTLIAAMTCFGLCKGVYDSNIFAAMYDFVEPRLRGTMAGLMNAVGWGGGALGPLFVGWSAMYGGRATEVENMSAAIGWCGLIYLAGAALLLFAAIRFAPHDRLGWMPGNAPN